MITHEEIAQKRKELAQKRLVAEMSDDFGQWQREVDEVSRLAAELGRLEGKMGKDTPVSPIHKRPSCGTHCATFEEALDAMDRILGTKKLA